MDEIEAIRRFREENRQTHLETFSETFKQSCSPLGQADGLIEFAAGTSFECNQRYYVNEAKELFAVMCMPQHVRACELAIA